MNKTQLSATGAGLVGVAAGYLAGRNALGLGLDAWTQILTYVVAAGAVVAPAVVTRLKSLKDTVGKSGAVVVTDKATADALPANPNVIAATPAITAVVGPAA